MAREYFEDEAPSIKPKKSREYFEDVSVVEKPEAGPVIGASAAEMIPTGGYPKAPKPTVMAGEPSYLEKASIVTDKKDKKTLKRIFFNSLQLQK